MKIFISHAAADRALASRLARTLVSSGYEVASDDVPITEDWLEAIRKSIVESSNVVVMFSDQSANNANVMFELGAAASLQKPIIVFDLSGSAADVLGKLWITGIRFVDATQDFEGAASQVATLGKTNGHTTVNGSTR